MTGEELFGPGRDWNAVRQRIRENLVKKMTRKNWYSSPDIIEDAVSAAVVDLSGYWMTLPSSITPGDFEKNWNYAMRRAGNFSTDYFVKAVTEENETRRLLVDQPRQSHTASPAEDAWVDDLREWLDALLFFVLDSQDAEIVRLRWFDGMTLRDTALKVGVSHSTVRRREHIALERLRSWSGRVHVPGFVKRRLLRSVSRPKTVQGRRAA